ncbi:class I SAM-dependent methyltransferase [Haloprofundus halobius]|uniref:class I SAM-dependent methyltransferase n=1 Tax=Haloprofundus halobius TaxID=2876194 RepID=UPI001CCD0835|nr:methyltransferase domain-containing protein [Haloprofundus halobius]
MPDSSNHKSTVREEFTKQATAYAANASLTDPEKVDRLIRATNASSDARVLEVATGPGHIALGFADVCDEVVGIDLTEAPLVIAEETRQKRGVTNVHFQKGDAEMLPFDDNTFDIVVCRLAFHHFENPSRVLQQMARVCRPNGTVGVADLIVSEYSKRGNYQNRFEQLRDPSHVRALSMSSLIELFTENGLEVHNVETGVLVPEVEQWLSNAQTPDSRADKVREMIKEDANEDLSGARPFWQNGDLHFVQRTAIIIGRRLKKSVHNATQSTHG